MKNLVKNKYGYFAVENMPTQAELEQYYRDKYYQENRGSYEQDYDEEEINYFKNKIQRRAAVISKHLKGDDKERSFLDIGCGEGWALSYFQDKNWEVLGLDYSSFGCEKFNPQCRESLVVGDVYTSLNDLIDKHKKFDVIYMDHLLEHVIDPEALITDIKKIIKPSGILVIEVPNDFSFIQKYLLDKGYINKEFWIAVPDHLSYFSREGLDNLLSSNGWKALLYLGDYPIDVNLLNPNSNYIQNPSLGKSCHRERIEFENLVHTRPMEQVINFYASMSELGLGREILGFFKLNEDIDQRPLQ